jgi:hypothetical protein
MWHKAIVFLRILMSFSCKSHYKLIPIEIRRIYYYPVYTTEEKWIQPKHIYSELYPVT